ncbi:Protein SRG1 [Linum perenne]
MESPAHSVEPVNFGKSLIVPSVQQLARECTDKIPPRYERPQIEPLVVSAVQFPVIDVEKLYDDDEDQELGRLHEACKDWGFFQLVNHGVSDSLLERVNLPTHLRRPHLFPMLPLPLRDTLEEYSAALKILAMKILNQMAKALRMDEKDMKVLFEEEGWQQFRMNYYPPCPQPELVMGLNSHSDAVGLTILLQVTADTQGLQVKKDGYWVPVTPLAGALIVNVGDILEIVSNGVYRSIEHRATVNSEKERISVGTFLSPRLDGEIGPAPSLVTPNSPAQFRRISVPDYFKGYFSRELIGKSYVDVMRIHNHS